MQSGTLIAKIQRHVVVSTIHPPRIGPSAAAMPENPAHVPIAGARSFAMNEAWMRESAPGVSRAAPTPCSTRRATS